jgi:hypothetical protein
VPDVVGLTKFDAYSALTAAALVIGDTFYEYSDTIPAGIVIDQDPENPVQLPAASPVDLWVSLGQPIPAISLASERLVELQNNDGGWDIPLDDGDPDAGTDIQNMAVIAAGLARAYAITEDPNTLSALANTRTLLLAKTDSFVVTDGALAVELDSVFGDTACTDHVRVNFFDKLAAGTYYDVFSDTVYDTASYIQALRDARDAESSSNLAAWDLGLGLYDAHLVGADANAWIPLVKTEIDELDGEQLYDAIGLSGAILGLAAVGAEHDPQAGMYASAASLQDLADFLAANQLNTGGFTWHRGFLEDNFDETVHETAYAIMALNEFDRVAYAGRIIDAGLYLHAVQLLTGGWKNYDLAVQEENQLTGEALGGIVMALGYVLVPDLTDLESTDANAVIVLSGLVADGVEYEYNDTIAYDHVVSQDPAGDTLVSIGTSVDIVLSLGLPIVPDVEGMTESDANLAIEAVER